MDIYNSFVSNWIDCNNDLTNNPYCNEDAWLLTPNEKELTFLPPENTDFYPDAVKLTLTASDPFYNSGISEDIGSSQLKSTIKIMRKYLGINIFCF